MLKDIKNDDKLTTMIIKNKDKLEDLITNCNNNINIMKENLCISHNDYKVKNILWDDLKPTLIDFDASALSNPTCCLSESAFTFSKINSEINYDHYKVYLEHYINSYGTIKDDFKKALYVSMNGKLQWYTYLISRRNTQDILAMTKELLLFYENIDKFYEIYRSIS